MKRQMLNRLAIGAALFAIAGGAIYLYTSTVPEPSSSRTDSKQEKSERNEDAVVLNDEKVAEANIELAKAGPGTLHESFTLNGILQPNQEALVQVTPRFSGVVREVSKRIGDKVEKGDLIGKIESNQSLTVYELRAPIAGTIIDRQAALGEFASEQKPVFVIADLGTVWADFAVYRRDLGRLQAGTTVLVDPEDGGPIIESKVSYLAPVGSADTQSALARAVVPNPEHRLRPGLFVTGRILLPKKQVPLAIKTSALQTHENKTVVFVRSGDRFEARPVELGDRDADYTEVRSGLESGEIYAAKNSFVVKAEIGKGAASHED